MTRIVTMTLVAVMVCIGSFGCGRMISEGVGVATGASGKVVSTGMAPDLTQYKGLHVEGVTVAPSLQVPAEMPELVKTELMNAAAARGLTTEGHPAINLSAEIIHYETGGAVDKAIGPLQEVIVHTKLVDAQTGKLLAEGNLVGRSKATSSSGPKNLAGGVGKALDKWLKDAGLKKAGEKENE